MGAIEPSSPWSSGVEAVLAGWIVGSFVDVGVSVIETVDTGETLLVQLINIMLKEKNAIMILDIFELLILYSIINDFAPQVSTQTHLHDLRTTDDCLHQIFD